MPSQEEIAALLIRQEMTTIVYCHGGGSCKISINSHTTAGEVRRRERDVIEFISILRHHFNISSFELYNEMTQHVLHIRMKVTSFFVLVFVKVVEKLIRGLAMENSRNMFSLFEHNKVESRAIESRVIVADVLAKFER